MSFEQRIKHALDDQELGRNFRGAMDFLQQKRKSAIEDEALWQTYRAFGSDLRQHVVAHLPELLEQLEQNCQKNGIQVHWAEDAGEANELILNIAQSQNALKFVKGKSMVSEEIELNEFLADHQIEACESDMGEFIVQSAHEKPSHIIMPAIHKNQQQIADLFEQTIGCHADANDVDQLIGIGRKVLRQKFKEADIGLSGVNFAIADSGTLCLVENEGNGRMSTTIPKTHIALMGLEKVIPSSESLPPLLHLLTRSATGQAITTYLNLIHGPRRSIELDGPQTVHLIILDNGRSDIAEDSELNATLKCIRCGACMNHCPVYTRIGGHAYGSTYPGPIGQVVMPQLKGGEGHTELLSACSLNASCGDACPVEVPLPSLIRTLRTRQSLKKPGLEAWIWKLWAWLNTQPKLYRAALKLAPKLGLYRTIVPAAWRRSRSVPKPAKHSLHRMMKEHQARD